MKPGASTSFTISWYVVLVLMVIDVYSRECLAIEVGSRLRGEDVARVLNGLVYLHRAPKALFADNGAEFTGQIVGLWAYHHKAGMDFFRPGTVLPP